MPNTARPKNRKAGVRLTRPLAKGPPGRAPGARVSKPPRGSGQNEAGGQAESSSSWARFASGLSDIGRGPSYVKRALIGRTTWGGICRGLRRRLKGYQTTCYRKLGFRLVVIQVKGPPRAESTATRVSKPPGRSVLVIQNADERTSKRTNKLSFSGSWARWFYFATSAAGRKPFQKLISSPRPAATDRSTTMTVTGPDQTFILEGAMRL